ncbi:hypothetical protein DC31_09770 [Microbacterium sp. CH12i]|uniref:LpqB family beta-propeller domain-containing protein n=1 Tax=Microbacterium sp. CH12i TaxID=1479651 RepID=UPI000461DC14|nr:LpqB family beta-propeller domain-containing protein [Microbacterium sp. CH12i]KDA06640.1 hypothetical protein DC31_09770 [Microbacterium sp. CH12i]
MSRSRRGLLIGIVAMCAAALTACAGLPTSGDVKVGLALDDVGLPPDISQIAAEPLDGASPAEIVEGFLDAAVTPSDGWKIAREFLSPDLAATWRPSVGVTIDSGAAARVFTSAIDGEADTAKTGDVRVRLDQIARVDEFGAYTEVSGDASVASFEVARNSDGEWRITAAADGIVLDAEAFTQVYRRYSLQYYDQSWTHLVPDVRWYPRRVQIATTLTQALLTGAPSEWLAPAVRSAFPNDVSLARDAVPLNSEKVATVELTSTALALDATQLARMRTQLEETLRLAGVSQVQLTVNGRDLNAGRATVEAASAEPGAVLLTETEFGAYLGNEITPYDAISPEIIDLAPTVVAVDMAADDSRAAVQLDTGGVYTVADGRVDQLDSRAGLIKPSLDPFGYTWTVQAAAPQALIAWQPDVTPLNISNAFPDASAISQLRVGPDGVRIAAVVTLGGQHWIVLAAIIRDQNQIPVELGPLHLVAQLDGAGLGLSWIGVDHLGVLVDAEDSREVLNQDIGGPGVIAAAPEGAVSLSGGRTASAVRILNGDGVLFAQRGTTWQMGRTDVLVLGTHAGR